MTDDRPAGPLLLIANPSADVYGSDLQMLETVRAVVARGWRVLVLSPQDGPLAPRLRAAGATMEIVDYPVLRRAFASPLGLVRLAGVAALSLARLRRKIHTTGATVVYVNTVTLPWWLLAARLARIPAICHVHEAEVNDSRSVRMALTAPLALATRVIANGEPAAAAARQVVPRLTSKMRVIENGVAAPPIAITRAPSTGPARLLVLGRLSPRKATHVALEALATLRANERDVVLELCGDAFEGYEWYVAELHERANRSDLAGAVTFSGYVSDVWGALARSRILVAPSLGESMGNAVIQAQLAGRPVVASDVQGHREAVVDGVSGLLVPAEDPVRLAEAIASLLDDSLRVTSLTEAAARMSGERFSTARYDAAMAEELSSLCAVRPLQDPSGRGAN